MPPPAPIPAALAIDSLQGDARAAFDLAADARYHAVAFATNHAELAPDRLDQSARRHLKSILASKRLTIDSLHASGGGRTGLTDPATVDRTLDSARKAFLLARDLGISTVSLHIGPISQSKIPESTLISALRDLSQHADASGLILALSADTLAPLHSLLKHVDYDRAKINLDSARLIAAGEDPLQFAESLAGSIAQFTAADAIRAGSTLRAAPLGQGQLPLRQFLSLLHEQGFQGPLVVDPRNLSDPAAAAREAADLLRNLLP